MKAVHTVFAGLILFATTPAQAKNYDEIMRLCAHAEEPAIREESCSYLIAHSRDRIVLERAYLGRGNANMTLRRFENAVKDFTKVIRLNPRIAGYFDNRLHAFLELGQYQDALNDANKAVILAPGYSFVYTSRAIVYTKLDQYESALIDFGTAIQRDPSASWVYFERGKLFGVLGRYSDAIDAFSRTLSLEKNGGDALKQRGLAYLHIGNNRAAADDLRAYLIGNPEDQEAADALSGLRKESPGFTSPSTPRPAAPSAVAQEEPPPPTVTTSREIDSVSAAAINKRIGELGSQIQTLAKLIKEQSELSKDADSHTKSSIEQTIAALNSRIDTLKTEYSRNDKVFSEYLTSIRPRDRDAYVTARRASEAFPRIPYYIPGTDEVGEFWIEPEVTDKGELLFAFKFVDTAAAMEKVRGKFDMTLSEIENFQNALLKLHDWSEKAHKEGVHRSYEKRVICFPAADCPAEGTGGVQGRSSTEIGFVIYEDGSTAGRIQRHKGRYVDGYNMSIDSALMLQAYLRHVIKATKEDFHAGTQTNEELNTIFK